MDAEVAGRTSDDVRDSLAALAEALRENVETSQAALQRAAVVAARRKEGLPYREIVSDESRPLMVELITENLERLRAHGARFRRALTLALYEEGMTMEDIAELYGVTRQRISALLREAAAEARTERAPADG